MFPTLVGMNRQLYVITHRQLGVPHTRGDEPELNCTARHEWLEMHLFTSIEQAQLLATKWLWTYNNERLHLAIDGVPLRTLLEAA